MDKEKIYNRIDADEELTDSEKRSAYHDAISDEEWERREEEEEW